LIHFDKSSQESRNGGGVLRLLLNVWLMGECNELLVTSVSNFGRCGADRRLTYPIRLFWQHESTCERLTITTLLEKPMDRW